MTSGCQKRAEGGISSRRISSPSRQQKNEGLEQGGKNELSLENLLPSSFGANRHSCGIGAGGAPTLLLPLQKGFGGCTAAHTEFPRELYKGCSQSIPIPTRGTAKARLHPQLQGKGCSPCSILEGITSSALSQFAPPDPLLQPMGPAPQPTHGLKNPVGITLKTPPGSISLGKHVRIKINEGHPHSNAAACPY